MGFKPVKGELTDREREVFGLICEGKTNQQIADELHLSVETVKTHHKHIKTKIDLRELYRMLYFISKERRNSKILRRKI